MNLLRVVDLFFLSPLWTVPQIQKVLGVDFKSAQRNIGELEKTGFVRELTGKKYRKLYAAEEVLNIVTKDKMES